jgi:hypothetical protein
MTQWTSQLRAGSHAFKGKPCRLAASAEQCGPHPMPTALAVCFLKFSHCSTALPDDLKETSP